MHDSSLVLSIAKAFMNESFSCETDNDIDCSMTKYAHWKPRSVILVDKSIILIDMISFVPAGLQKVALRN